MITYQERWWWVCERVADYEEGLAEGEWAFDAGVCWSKDLRVLQLSFYRLGFQVGWMWG